MQTALPSVPPLISRWVRLSLVNLLIVSILGVVLRYKGAFPLIFLNYKYLLNAHSHFAFSGWITSILFSVFVYLLAASGVEPSRSYRYQFWLNQLSGYGMLVSFTCQGYGSVAIFFSALSVVFSYWFAFQYWRDLGKVTWPPLVKPCMRLALVFLVLSSLGPYLLAYSMSHAIGDMAFYYNAIYFYLHFQYNGWFLFGVAAMVFWWTTPAKPARARIFVLLMGTACIPCYCLSLLWTDPALWIKTLAAAGAATQVVALAVIFPSILSTNTRPDPTTQTNRTNGRPKPVSRPARTLWTMAFTAFTIKIVLQALSAIPALGKLAFGYRSVVIAYLHLVMLCLVTFAVLGFLLECSLLTARPRPALAGLTLFVIGVIGNEVILLIQTLQAYRLRGWPPAPYLLFAAAVVMFLGLGLFAVSQTHDREMLKVGSKPG